MTTRHYPSVGSAQFTDEFLNGLRHVGDEPADKAVTTYFTSPEGRSAEPRDVIGTVTHSSKLDRDDEDLPGIGEFVKDIAAEKWPDWAIPDAVAQGQHVFERWGLMTGTSLFSASLPTDYTFHRGAEVLVRTQMLTRQPHRRVLETGQLILDAMKRGGLDPAAKGAVEVRHVRLLHAAVRYVLTHPDVVNSPEHHVLGPWDDERLFVPINQEQLLGTLFSFTISCLDSLERIGARISDDDAESLVHAWNVVGHMMGIRGDLLPLNLADSRTIFASIKRLEQGESDAGRQLAQSLVELDQAMLHLPRGLRNYPATAIRRLAGPEVGDMLKINKSDWTGLFLDGFFGLNSILSSVLRVLPILDPIPEFVGRRFMEAFEFLERTPGRSNFEIPSELKHAWGVKARKR
jgi:hypothetical protein